jgi:hypothetical protein
MCAHAESSGTRWLPVLLLSLLVAATCAKSAAGQALNGQWRTVDAGGGLSSAGVYALQGTIGQPDASAAFGTIDYSITGGFWRAEQSLAFRLIFADGFASGNTSAWSATVPIVAEDDRTAAPRADESRRSDPPATPPGG